MQERSSFECSTRKREGGEEERFVRARVAILRAVSVEPTAAPPSSLILEQAWNGVDAGGEPTTPGANPAGKTHQDNNKGEFRSTSVIVAYNNVYGKETNIM